MSKGENNWVGQRQSLSSFLQLNDNKNNVTGENKGENVMRKSILAVGFLLMCTPVFAGTLTVGGNVVKANVVGNCVMVSPFTLDFGAYDPLVTNAAAGADLDVTAGTPLQIKCTKKTSYTVDLNRGLNVNGAFTQRGMLGAAVGPDTLYYNIFTTAARTTIWGSTMTGGAIPAAALSASSTTTISIPIYGRVYKGQDVGVDTYNDTVIATVNF